MQFIDIHTHPSLKPFHNRTPENTPSLWVAFYSRKDDLKEIPLILRGSVRRLGFAGGSQSDLSSLLDGEVKTACFALHPIERGWFTGAAKTDSIKLLPFVSLKLKDKYPFIIGYITGIPPREAARLLDSIRKDEPIDYFKEAFEEYAFVVSQEGKNPDEKILEIVSQSSELGDLTETTTTVRAFFSIEGGHALFNRLSLQTMATPYEQLSESEQADLEAQARENILRIKGTATDDPYQFAKNHTPFFLTLAHFFNNFLAGHAPSFPSGGLETVLLNQSVGLNTGISSLGRKVINQLLSRENGRRVLVDVKHMSMKARNEYYKMVQERRQKGDPVPIICSHAACNGFQRNELTRVDSQELNSQDGYFNRWSINLSDEDIVEIVASDGLIGLVLHEGRMPGNQLDKNLRPLRSRVGPVKLRIDELVKELREKHLYHPPGNARLHRIQKEIGRLRDRILPYRESLEREYIRLVLSHIFHIVKVCRENGLSAWPHIGLGTDFDGIMNPLDLYNTATDFPDLARHMLIYLQEPALLMEENHSGFKLDGPLLGYSQGKLVTISLQQMLDLYGPYSAEEIAAMVANQNAANFLKRYFTSAYLEEGELPHLLT